MNIVAYAYNAAIHCTRCAMLAKMDRIGAKDREGNNAHPVFNTDEEHAGYCDDCGHAYGGAAPVVRLLCVDAWRDGGGWTWNAWHNRGMVPAAWCDLSPRMLLHRLRKRGGIALPAPGRAMIEDDGYNIVIMLRSTREPVAALAYGETP